MRLQKHNKNFFNIEHDICYDARFAKQYHLANPVHAFTDEWVSWKVAK